MSIEKDNWVDDWSENNWSASSLLVGETAWSIESIIDYQEQLSELYKRNWNEVLPEHLVETVLSKMTLNFPAYEMFLNLDIGSTFTSYIFTNVKKMNDRIGQAKVDIILELFKSKYIAYMHAQWKDCHAVWDDYKNFVLIPEIDEIEEFVLQRFMDEAIEQATSDEEKELIKDIEKLWVVWDNWIIEYDTISKKTSIISSLAENRMQLEKIYSGTYQGYLDFYKQDVKQVGLKQLEAMEVETLSQWDETYMVSEQKYRVESKENGNYELDLYAQDWATISPTLIAAFLKDEIPKALELHTLLSETIYARDMKSLVLERAEGNTPETQWKTYSIIPSENPENPWFLEIKEWDKTQQIKIFDESWFFSIPLITLVRKQKIPIELALYKKVRKVLDMLVADWEFIFPYWEWKWTISMEEYRELQKSIKNWEEIDMSLLKRACNWYYKWGLSKEWFAETIREKSGQLFFIDIKDMGSVNMKDFSDTLTLVQEWTITKKQAIVQSWGVMTEKFIEIIDELEQELWAWKIEFNIGGDEIKLFIEWAQVPKKTAITINKTIAKQWIYWRITTMKYRWAGSSETNEELIDKLDWYTTYSKDVENLFWAIEARLDSQKREIWAEVWKLNNIRRWLTTDIFSSKALWEKFMSMFYQNYRKEVNKMNKTLDSMYNFYIELDDQNHNNDRIHFGWKWGSFLLSEIFDSKTKKLVPRSAFTDLLDQKWLSR